MSRNRRNNSLQTTLKDYAVPIIGGVLILIVIYSFLGGNENTVTTQVQNGTTEISFNDTDTEAFIIYPGDVKEKITNNSTLNTDDTVVVESGSLTLNPLDGNTINLNKIAEFKISEDGTYNLYSSDAWISTKQDTNISMRYASINAPADSIISLTQNEAGSTVYALAGDVKVSNLAGISTLVAKGQKVSISRLNAAKDDLDLAASKTSIDSYFKGSDWFIANQGNATLNADDVTISPDEFPLVSASGSTTPELGTTEITGEGASTLYLKFDSLRDEMTYTENIVNITGTVTSDTVGSITIDNAQATIKADRTFEFSGVSLPNSINDLVVKVYDTNQSLVDKEVYTLYSSAPGAGTPQSPTTSSTTGGGATFEVDATKFGFTTPSVTGKFSTTSPEVTIRGFTTAKGISKVQVNGFTLNSFNGANWRYHAFKRFTTLKEGSNQYKIDYFGSNGSIVYTDYFTIVKKSAVVPAAASTPTPAVAVPTPAVSPASEESLFAD